MKERIEMAIGGRAKPAGGFELYSWFFMRISGVILIIMALGHLYIMHIAHNVNEMTQWKAEGAAAFVKERYAGVGWRIYDFILLFLALLHGLNGIKWLIDDYIENSGWRLFLISLLYIIAFIFLTVGSIFIFSFKT